MLQKQGENGYSIILSSHRNVSVVIIRVPENFIWQISNIRKCILVFQLQKQGEHMNEKKKSYSIGQLPRIGSEV